jgi:hypothetical protein
MTWTYSVAGSLQFYKVDLQLWARITQLVEWLTTGWTVWGSNCGGWARFSAPVQTGPGAHPVSCTMGTTSFPRVERLGCVVDHASSSVEVEGRVQLYICSPFGPLWPVLGWNFTDLKLQNKVNWCSVSFTTDWHNFLLSLQLQPITEVCEPLVTGSNQSHWEPMCWYTSYRHSLAIA